ncbi:helix-turn-helix transcriptional regulator [Histidinibacterium aquaticum]|uniref:Helix-turn-helix transcriptional regulator n=1 Tax=Histidinibacterium aquaticum TaxID=2613962 RepID=A0A5J5GEK9_9RHOB|nr:helix-turn-helix transcriptional regulator [Histidinibacterium aquaticum]KAA9006649.1 helix-turn-helix transcriptional regulator [Histidinibacterium aquaticum]
MTPEQLRMARAAVKLGVRELASEAGVAPATVTRLEGGKGGINMRSQAALREALEARGIQFLENGQVASGPGVAVRQASSQ